MKAPRHVHFIGVGGIHMSGLARILLADGVRVSGSDLTPSHLTDRLRELGATVSIGHDARAIGDADLVVRTLAVPNDNPEIAAALSAGIETISRAKMVARIAADWVAVAVSGSHGKTTTATMVVRAMQTAGLDPTYILGGESVELESHAARGEGAHIVLEADEYGRAFHEYHPAIAVITNLERDHLDYYGTDEALFEAFVTYANTLEPGGRLIVGAESPCAMAVGERITAQRDDITIERFGIGNADTAQVEWRAHTVVDGVDGLEFVVEGPEVSATTYRLQIAGEHNVRNALAATAAAAATGAPIESIVEALGAFRGVRRRFQPHGEAAGVLVMDDYAHHPSEIQATIRAARSRLPGRRLVVLFQPHTYSRSKYLLEGFTQCFSGADALYLTDTYAARETPEAGLSAVDLAAHIGTPGAIYAGSLEEAATRIVASVQAGDVVFTMGAGDVDQAGPLILRGLETA